MKASSGIAFFALVFLVFSGSCIDEVPVESLEPVGFSLDDVLVVDARITNENKRQRVLLSRPTALSADSSAAGVPGASVTVSSSQGSTFQFEESDSGSYVSTQPFAAIEGVEYTLEIELADGQQYLSAPASRGPESTIDRIYAQRELSNLGVDGISIYVDSSNPDPQADRYRYEYEETYKIIAPNWTASEFEILQDFSLINEGIYPDVRLVPRAQEERVCYNTVASTEILLSNGLEAETEELRGNLIRFLGNDNPVISHRYSILVRQYLQSPEAYSFYTSLRNFSSSDNVFNQIQPGLLEGNIEAVNDADAIVLGYFEVTSVTETRFFFNYEDFYPGEPLPPYFETVNCDRIYPPRLVNPERDGPSPPDECGPAEGLTELIEQEIVEYYITNSEPPGLCEGPYFVTQRACGDCTALGSNIVPDFWEE
ncbi:MAG: DUF4249 domain-containing protein [Robiginitalea sp.]|uniref:DUF4249 domain-containing protein n=1 Tax=Robiginitalea sp. TaxID=1902411 RepID=UPI003C7106C9